MWWLAACGGPGADELLRRHDLDGAAAAWEKQTGAPLDVDHRVADVLSTRAAKDPTITVALLAGTMEAVRLLERAPDRGSKVVDRPFDSFSTLGGAIEKVARGSFVVAVGRSELPSDRDPYFANGDLPWSGGRLVGWERDKLDTLARTLEDRPPVRLVTIALRDSSCEQFLFVERAHDAWWVRSATDPNAAAALLIVADGGAVVPGRGVCPAGTP